MSDEKARQTAENHTTRRCDLVAEGHQPSGPSPSTRPRSTPTTFTSHHEAGARAAESGTASTKRIAVANRIAEIDPDDVLAHTSLPSFTRKKA